MRFAFWRPRLTPVLPEAPQKHRGNRQVRMLRTVWSQDGEWLADRVYGLTEMKADEFILHGYATGDLSREYTLDEIARLVNGTQEIRFGG